ncbi:MAG: hypothetical protein R2681_03565 [Pyrinomonadaceae bacterium]
MTVCLTLPSSANAQILEKLKDALGGKTSTAPEENTAKTKNTAAKRAFYVKDVVTKSFDKQKQARTTNCFDAEEIAMQVNWTDPKSKESQKSYVDSEGYFTSYNESEGEYQKSNLVSSGVMGMIGPSMMLSVYKLPVGPYMERTENLKKQGVNANAFMYLEFAFIYDPGHFRNSNYSETKTRCRGGSDCTKFGIREKGYDDSFILFDNKDRLAEINIKIKDSPHFGTNEGLIEYFYDQTCSVSVPAAKEVRGPGLDIFR